MYLKTRTCQAKKALLYQIGYNSYERETQSGAKIRAIYVVEINTKRTLPETREF